MIESVGRPLVFLLLVAVGFVVYQAIRSYADRPSNVKVGIAALRGSICVLLILELAGVTYWWTGKAGDEYVTFVVDVSDSVSAEMRTMARDEIARATAARDAERMSLILFGETPQVVIPFGQGLNRTRLTEVFKPYAEDEKAKGKVSGKASNLERAIQAALTGFPAQVQKKIILVTDGNETDGDALKQAAEAERQQAQISATPLVRKESNDVVVVSLEVPEQIKREEAFEIRCHLNAASEIRGKLSLFVDDYLAAGKEVELTRGKSEVTFRRSLKEGGQHLLQVHFESDVEQPVENDKAFVYIDLPGRPQVLVISSGDENALVDSLSRSRFRVEQRSPAGAPATMLDFTRYDAVILANIAAEELGENRMRLLRDYVARFGGGLVLTGGPNSFGPGGYAGTPIEEASPVSMEISLKERPSTSVILVVDDSRSMWLRGTPDLKFDKEDFVNVKATYTGLSTTAKAEYVKEVFKRVALSLSDRDRIGAIGLTSELSPAQWYIRPQRVTDKPRLINHFGTAFQRQKYSILIDTVDDARFVLVNDSAVYKQVLLLTDGYVSADEDYYKLAQMFLSDGFSVSTVGVGKDSNHKLLDELARWGGGRYFPADDLKNIGDVYEKEMTAPSTELVVQRVSQVSLIESSPMLKGLDVNLAPDLFGYVRTRPKTRAKTLLTIEGTKDPVLASWNYQSGKVVAFTSAAVGSWATLWEKDWEGYARFWRQVVESVFRESGEENYRIHMKPDGSKLRVAADILDSNDNFVNGTEVTTRLYYLGERGDVFSPAVSWEKPLNWTAPGRYESEFELERVGVYMTSVQGQGKNAGSIATSGAILPIPPEMQSPYWNETLLTAVCQIGKGQVKATVVEAADVKGLDERRRKDLGYPALILAALLLVVEVLTRRWPAFVEFHRTRTAGGKS
ncbi:MAG: VWA domain-containing protein [Planctomycetota bacterium]|nr:VWA domain-containing protein [Planctomycetota bacterium]MDA1142444.1 VWA domain-containing protein [Planctomycetota bacterium]